MLLKLRHDGPLSNFAFNFNLRRYTMVEIYLSPENEQLWDEAGGGLLKKTLDRR